MILPPIHNTQFQKHKLNTWTSPDGKTMNQIDFILTRNTSVRQTILDSTVLNSPDTSDHRMVRTKVRFNFSWPKKTPITPKFNLEPLLLEAKEPFQLKLSNRFSCLSELLDSEEIYEEISSGILEAAKEVLPLQEKYLQIC